jgi:ABC-type transport system involved in cytochrome bd biosynthesis fused ATPase/permease subunit
MDKDQLLERLETVQLELEAKVGEAHGQLNELMEKAEGFTRLQYAEAMQLYTESVQELDDFLKSAKAQKQALTAWIVDNKKLLLIGAGLLFGGMVLAALLISAGPTLF